LQDNWAKQDGEIMKTAHLIDRALVRIDGEVAVDFLQNLITCNVEQLNEGEASFGALLTPQGKILFDFFCIRTTLGFLFDIASELQADFIKRMTFYKLRTPVEIAAASNGLKVFAVWNHQDKLDIDAINIEDGHAFFDPRFAKMGVRIISSIIDANADLNDYNSHRISLGMPEGGADYSYGDTFPHDAMMDQFESKDAGIAFTKGCYVGQEVVSRMQHRGTARRRVVMINSDQPLPVTGSGIQASGKAIGKIGSCLSTNGLAMVRIDRLASALENGDDVSSEGIILQAKLPEWASISLNNDQKS
jgi:folate-binding protein YgfZ